MATQYCEGGPKMLKGETPLGVAEAAKVLGVPVSWVYSRIERPSCDLPHYRMGRYLRFYASELQKFIDSQRGGPRP